MLGIPDHNHTEPMTIEQLQPWCSEDLTRYSICTPYRDGEWVIATNGKLLIRVPYDESIHGDIRRDGPPTSKTFRGTEHANTPTQPEEGWKAIPVKTTSCGDCGGVGSWEKCTTCDGEGLETCYECGHEHDCEDCNGKGYTAGPGEIKCEECDGTGTLMNWPVIQLIRPGLAPLFISSNYLKLIMDIPGVQIFTHRYDDNRTPHRFTFEGGDGIFMTIRKPTRPQP